MDNASWIVNTLIERIKPWYPIEFQLISESYVEAKISKYYCKVQCENDEPYQALCCKLDIPSEPTIQATNFVNHLNGILAGKLRNDAGELVSA